MEFSGVSKISLNYIAHHVRPHSIHTNSDLGSHLNLTRGVTPVHRLSPFEVWIIMSQVLLHIKLTVIIIISIFGLIFPILHSLGYRFKYLHLQLLTYVIHYYIMSIYVGMQFWEFAHTFSELWVSCVKYKVYIIYANITSDVTK